MADDPIEEWRTIEQAPDYAVSNLGRVKRITGGDNTWNGRIMKLSVGADGYVYCALCSNGKSRFFVISRLACIAFHGAPPTPKYHAAHWDGNKAHNVSGNLRWATPSENHLDKVRHGRVPYGDKNPSRSDPKKRERALLIKADLASGLMRQDHIAVKHKVSNATVTMIKQGKRWAD
jgi:hypothetical protein